MLNQDTLVFQPTAREYENSVVMPVMPQGVKNHIKVWPLMKVFGGVYSNGFPVPEALLIRTFDINSDIMRPKPFQSETQAPYVEPKIRLSGQYIFCGILYPHFGHFIAESLARIWYAKQHPDIPIVWTMPESDEYFSWQQEILDILEIKNKAIFVFEPTFFQSLIIPSLGHVLPHFFTPYYFDLFKSITPKAIIPGKKLYITKPKSKFGGYTNEEEIEKILISQGWTIFDPTKHPVKYRFDEISSSEIVLTITSSSLYSFLFFKEIKTKIFFLCRNEHKVHNNNMMYKDYFGKIAKNLSLDCTYLNIPKKWIEGHQSAARYKLDMNIFHELMEKTSFLSENLHHLDGFTEKPFDDNKLGARLVSSARNSISTSQNDENTFHYEARVLSSKKLTDSAINSIKKSISINPNNSVTHFFLAELYISKNMIPEAQAELKIAIETDNEDRLSNIREKLARLYEQENKLDEAIKEVRLAIKYDSKNIGLLNFLGTLLKKQGNFIESEKIFTEVLEIEPGQALAMRRLQEFKDNKLSKGKKI